MPRPRRRAPFDRLDRPPSLTAQVEQLLRRAVAEGRFPGGRLPTAAELAEQLGVSRETVRLAAEALERDGLLVKVRRRGTFLRPPELPDRIAAPPPALLAYLQAGYAGAGGQEEAVTRVVSGLMLQGALEAAGAAGFRLVVRHAPHTQLGAAFAELCREERPRGVVFASVGEEKLLRRLAGRGLPSVLLDHDLPLPGVASVRDDSFEGARLAVRHLAGLGHRHIAFVHWHQADLNPWRLRGYRQGLRDAGLPRRRAWELAAELTPAGARRAADEFLALAPRPTALYCFNNTLARLLIDELARRGVGVPGDVSVLGGGGEVVPGLACHQADWHAMGRLAVELLLRGLNDPDRPAEHRLCPHAVQPGPTAGPPLR
jgi:LacI family transcriptional regulator